MFSWLKYYTHYQCLSCGQFFFWTPSYYRHRRTHVIEAWRRVIEATETARDMSAEDKRVFEALHVTY